MQDLKNNKQILCRFPNGVEAVKYFLTDANGKVQGVAKTMYNNITVREEPHQDNKLHGKCKYYTFDGKFVATERLFSYGVEKEMTIYHENTDKVSDITIYHSSNLIARRFFWQNGALQKIFNIDGNYLIQGLWCSFHQNSKPAIEAFYIDGKKHGKYTEYDTYGNIIKKGTYNNDVFISEIETENSNQAKSNKSLIDEFNEKFAQTQPNTSKQI